MKRLFVMATLVCLTWFTPAEAGWETTEWGMTAEQAAQAMPDLAHPHRHPWKFSDELTVRNVGDIKNGKDKLHVLFLYDKEGLAEIRVEPRPQKCQPFVERLLVGYGAPLFVSDQLILKVSVWHDKASDTRISLLTSNNICSVTYSQLAGHEADDLRRIGNR